MWEAPRRQRFRSARAELRSYGATQSFLARFGTLLLVGTTVVIAVALGLAANRISPDLDGFDVGSSVLAIGALVIGYQKWRAARSEVSLDKYYERIDIADRRLDEWPSARQMVNHFWTIDGANDDYEKSMYVYIELDNLEYTLVKYRLGYMNPDHALRGLRTFQSRCLSAEFRKLAAERVLGAGYQRFTTRLVTEVCREYEEESERSAGS